MELRPHLHRVYVAQHYLTAHAAAMHQLGFRRLPDADVDFDSGSNVVDVVVRSLRKKLGERAALIEAVRGTGLAARRSATAATGRGSAALSGVGRRRCRALCSSYGNDCFCQRGPSNTQVMPAS
jgi:hypothetical protein